MVGPRTCRPVLTSQLHEAEFAVAGQNEKRVDCWSSQRTATSLAVLRERELAGSAIMSARRADSRGPPTDRAQRPGPHVSAASIANPLVDAQQASKMLAVPASRLLAQARKGAIPHHRLGHYIRFDVDELAAWLREEQSAVALRRRR